MDLREYLFRNRMTQTALAKQVGITRKYIADIMYSRVVPGARLAKDIELATGGEVTVAELRPEKKIA